MEQVGAGSGEAGPLRPGHGMRADKKVNPYSDARGFARRAHSAFLRRRSP